MDEDLRPVLYRDMLKHPTAVTILTLFFGGGTGMLVQPFVLASEFDKHIENADRNFAELRGEIRKLGQNQCAFRKELNQYTLEGYIRVAEKEIYELDSLLAKEEATDRDKLRLSTVRLEKEKLQRSLLELSRLPECNDLEE